MHSSDGPMEFVQGPIDYRITGTRRWHDLAGWEQDKYLLACFLGEQERSKVERELDLYDRPAASIAEALLGPFYASDPRSGRSDFFPENASVSQRVFAKRVVSIENTLLGQRLLKAYGRASVSPNAPLMDPNMYTDDPILFFETVAPVRGMEILDERCREDLDASEEESAADWEALDAASKQRALSDLRFEMHQVDREARGDPMSLFAATGTARADPRRGVQSQTPESAPIGLRALVRRLFGRRQSPRRGAT